MSRYDLNIENLSTLLPMSLRKPHMLALLRSLLSPSRQTRDDFSTYRRNTLYRLNHTGQNFSLEKVINDFCHTAGCKVKDGQYYADVLLVPHNGRESLAHYQTPVSHDAGVTPYVYCHAAASSMDMTCFVVHLPDALQGVVDERRLCALIDSYKLAGKTYRIEYGNVGTTRWDFAWSSPVCEQLASLQELYIFRWSAPVCEQNILGGYYEFSWSIPLCVQQEKVIVSYEYK